MTEQHPAFGAAHLLDLARELAEAGQAYAVATVVSRRPPVSARVGDKAIITADGRLVGWIGGSCSQPVVRREAVAAIAAGRPRLVRLRSDAGAGAPDAGAGAPNAGAGVTTVPMTCPSGGEAEIYIEPHTARPRLVAVGATPLVRALGLLAPVVGFDATLVAEHPAELEGPVQWAARMTLDEYAATAFPAGTYFVIASAGHCDEEALLHALRTPAAHVALVASRRRSQAVFEVLAVSGCTAADLARVRTPAGIDIGAATQEEIALSVVAEMVARYRRGAAAIAAAGPRAAAPAGPQAIAPAGPQAIAPAGPPAAAPAGLAGDDLLPAPGRPALARDPVCGMDVEVAAARHTAGHGGQTYYFCCPHCRHRFVKEPERYLSATAAGEG